MSLQFLLLAAGVAFAAPAPVQSPAEEALAVMLSKVRQEHAVEMRRGVLGGAEDLRDAVAAGTGHERIKLAGRLPGMSEEPFDLCRTLARCREAVLSLHVEDDSLTDDALRALARPWIKLQEARGKAVKVTVDPGIGVQLELEDVPGLPRVILTASPAPTGGFDAAVEDGPRAARAYSAARAALLSAPK